MSQFLGHASQLAQKVTFIALLAVVGSSQAEPTRFDLEGPEGSVAFGAQIAVLPNGNLVVTDPRRPPDGAAYLYSGDGALISTVTNIVPGAHASLDTVKIMVLANGNYLLLNHQWRHGSINDAGMVAWASGESGLSGAISAGNALVGSRDSEMVGFFGVHPLANGNYVVRTLTWNDGAKQAGAVTWGSGTSGVSGVISAANSLVGDEHSDSIGSSFAALTNGNFVIGSVGWGTSGQPYRGAFTWVDGATGATGYVTAQNSMIGSAASDFFYARITPLVNGNYVVALPYWNNGAAVDAGAAVWADGSQPSVGVISGTNALVGAKAQNFVGYDEVQPLANGNYVVVSSGWDSVTGTNEGAVTWGSGQTGIVGEVSAANSLVGSGDSQFVGGHPSWAVDGAAALANGHFVVSTPLWNAGRGAVTWADGEVGIVGTVTAQNSLTGATAGDHVGVAAGSAVTPLTNGNYVVSTPEWHNAAGKAVGAATWVEGSGPRVGTVEAANSFVGSSEYDQVDVTPLTNGNYVVAAGSWDRGAIANAGAVAWGNGSVGTTGTYSPQTALVGASEWDLVGWPIALSDGSYIVCSRHFSAGTQSAVGAVTWGSGSGGLVGEIDATNSLIGSSANDSLCSDQIDYYRPVLPDGRYVIASPGFDDGGTVDAGAFTLGRGPMVGHLDHNLSVIGSVYATGESGGQRGLFAAYDIANERLVVGQPASNRVTFLSAHRIFGAGFGNAPSH